mmetsp:Transcript_33070/g.77358  ORF Transcript_33070/g.77358 Transcript_33070/m.77358 type:complete len:495 (+) Transcript_33070:88-1572(+)
MEDPESALEPHEDVAYFPRLSEAACSADEAEETLEEESEEVKALLAVVSQVTWPDAQNESKLDALSRLCDQLCSLTLRAVERRVLVMRAINAGVVDVAVSLIEGGSPQLKLDALARLCDLLCSLTPRTEQRRIFVMRAINTGVIDVAVSLIEDGSPEPIIAASNFLADLVTGSDPGAQAVLKVFHKIIACFQRVFDALTWDNLRLLEATVLLCLNIAAMCPSGHQLIVPLVQPVCLRIINNPSASDKLRGNTITLLANLSTTVRQELRSLRVAEVLLDMILEDRVSRQARSVAESIIIFLHGNRKCQEIDKLIAANVISEYCVPLMDLTLQGKTFRGIYPFLMYTAHLFQVLAQTREYAEALAMHKEVIPLLLRANEEPETLIRMDSDLDGCRYALEALLSLAQFGFWSGEDHSEQSRNFCKYRLPQLLEEEHQGIRLVAATLSAELYPAEVGVLRVIGMNLRGRLPVGLWREKVATFIFPSVAVSCRRDICVL